MASEDTLDIEALKQAYLGQESPVATMEVEKGHVRSFASAIGDSNPLWTDEIQARKSRYGGLIAPPTFLRTLRTQRLEQLPVEHNLNRLLDGGSTWEYFEPVRIGDRITAVNRVIDIYARAGRLGQMLFVVTETTYTNQLSQVVATQSNTSIRY